MYWSLIAAVVTEEATAVVSDGSDVDGLPAASGVAGVAEDGLSLLGLGLRAGGGDLGNLSLVLGGGGEPAAGGSSDDAGANGAAEFDRSTALGLLLLLLLLAADVARRQYLPRSSDRNMTFELGSMTMPFVVLLGPPIWYASNCWLAVSALLLKLVMSGIVVLTAVSLPALGVQVMIATPTGMGLLGTPADAIIET
jgi:hypothetical protein